MIAMTAVAAMSLSAGIHISVFTYIPPSFPLFHTQNSATPGRLNDLLMNEILSLRSVSYLVGFIVVDSTI